MALQLIRSYYQLPVANIFITSLSKTTCLQHVVLFQIGHVFPKDNIMKKKWIIAIKRNADKNIYWTPSKTSVVCKDHFIPSDYISETSCGTTSLVKRLKKDAVPSNFPWTNTTPVSSIERSNRKRKRDESKHDSFEMGSDLDMDDTFCDQTIDVGNEIYIAEKIEDSINTDPQLFSENTHVSCDMTTQTPSWPSLCIEKFEDDPAGIMFYTGLQSYQDFQFVLASLGKAAYHLNYIYYRSDQLSIENQLFLTLLKLRQHKTNFELSRLFNISETSVMNYWITWVNFMYYQWKEIDIWPNRDLVRFFSPRDFKKQFPTTRVVIDGTECPIKKPKLPTAQQATFSTYKNRNTVKLLVGATPGGLISFVSSGYGGSTSDRQICERSNLTRLCDQGDSIMADKGFNVQDLFAPYDVTINIPTFFRKKNRMTGAVVVKDRKISSKRVHIERLIGLAKTYKILKNPLNISETKLSTEITFVCFMLCNFKSCIIPENA